MMERPATTDHAGDERIAEAARFLATHPREKITGAVPAFLMRTFGLSALGAVAAIREAALLRARSH